MDSDHLRDELRVVAEVGVHDDNKVARGIFQAVDVSCTQTKLALTGLKDDVFRAIEVLELLRDLEGAVRGSVVDDNNFPIQLSIIEKEIEVSHSTLSLYQLKYILLIEGPLDQPDNDREVPPLIVGGKNDRVLVLGRRHFETPRVN